MTEAHSLLLAHGQDTKSLPPAYKKSRSNARACAQGDGYVNRLFLRFILQPPKFSGAVALKMMQQLQPCLRDG